MDLTNPSRAVSSSLSSSTECANCGLKGSLYCRQCDKSLCAHCTITAHTSSPLHPFFEITDAGHLRPTTAAEVGLDLNLGHSGDLCTKAPFHASVLVHIIQSRVLSQDIYINYCHCSGAPSHEDQLLSAGFLPEAVDGESLYCFTAECVLEVELRVLEALGMRKRKVSLIVSSYAHPFLTSFQRSVDAEDALARQPKAMKIE
jgi:ribosomal protein L31